MKAKYIVIFLLSLLSFVACDKEEVVIPTTAPRTVLIYFAGDNSLSGYVSQNLRAIKKGIERDGLNNGNLLIYTDKQNEAPQLFQLKWKRIPSGRSCSRPTTRTRTRPLPRR